MAGTDWPRATRPVVMGTHHMVSGGHYLAAVAGFRQLPALIRPHPYTPGLAHLEARLDPSIAEALLPMGHKLRMWPDWSKAAGSVGAIRIDPVHGVLHGAADSRRMAYAIGR